MVLAEHAVVRFWGVEGAVDIVCVNEEERWLLRIAIEKFVDSWKDLAEMAGLVIPEVEAVAVAEPAAHPSSIGEGGRTVASLTERTDQRCAVIGKSIDHEAQGVRGLEFGQILQVAIGGLAYHRQWIFTRQHRAVGDKRLRCLCDGRREERRVSPQAGEVGGSAAPVAVEIEMIGAQCVQGNQNDQVRPRPA